MVVGLTASLEEARANGEAIDDETINGLRAGLMGPLAGLGDSIIVGTFIPILLGIALGLSKGGSVLGPLFYVVVWNLIMYFGMKFAYDQGYSLGSSAVEALVGPESEALRSSIVMIGTMVIGSVAATWINVTTSLNIAGVDIQTTLNGIFPKVLNLLFVYLCWWLMTKKKLSPTVVMSYSCCCSTCWRCYWRLQPRSVLLIFLRKILSGAEKTNVIKWHRHTAMPLLIESFYEQEKLCRSSFSFARG